MKKGIIIALGTGVGLVAVGTAAVTLWNSRRFRAMRAIRRTNAVLHRIGNTLCKISEATDGCMA